MADLGAVGFPIGVDARLAVVPGTTISGTVRNGAGHLVSRTVYWIDRTLYPADTRENGWQATASRPDGTYTIPVPDSNFAAMGHPHKYAVLVLSDDVDKNAIVYDGVVPS